MPPSLRSSPPLPTATGLGGDWMKSNVRNDADRLSLAISAANLGDWNWDAATDFITLSPRTAEIYGVDDSTQLTRTQLRNLLVEEDRVSALRALKVAMETRSDYAMEYRVVRSDGSMRWVAVNGRPVFGPDGQILGMVGVVQDITDRKEQVQKLQSLTQEIESQARLFDATLSNLTDLAYAFDRNVRFIYANKPLLTLFGRTLNEVVGKTFSELDYPPEVAARLTREVLEVFSTKRARRGEVSFVSAAGVTDDHEYIYNPVLGASGEVVAVAGSTRLVTERRRAEEVLRQTRARLDTTLVAAEIGTWLWDISSNRVIPDENLARLLGLATDETGGSLEDFVNIIHADDRSRVVAEITAAIAGGNFESDYRLVSKNGEIRWFTARGQVHRDAEDRPISFSGVLIEITARKLAEAVGESQRQVLQLIAEDAPLETVLDALISTIERAIPGGMRGSILLVRDGHFLHGAAPSLPAAYNAAVEGTAVDSGLGPCALSFTSRQPCYVPDIAAADTMPVFRDLALHHGLKCCWSTPIFSSNGEVLGTFAIYYPEPRQPEGTDLKTVELVTRTAAIAIENKQAAAALRTREAQLRLVTDNAPVLLVQIDREYRYTFVNRAYADRNGRKPEDMIGMTVADALGRQAFDSFRIHMDTALTGDRVEFEQQVPYAHLGARWVNVIFVPDRDATGHVVGLLAVISDIGPRKQAELELKKARDEALAASRAKDDFLAALSHELRTPLNPVLLLASDAASNPQLPESVRADFELIRKNVDLEARLIDDLLDLTRITRGKLTVEQQPCDLRTVIEDARTNVLPDLQEKQHELVCEFNAPHYTVLGDAVRLQQVFWNILKNAVKFTPRHGRILLSIRHDKPRNRLTAEISDSGIGMSTEEIDRVFQPFSQGDHALAGASAHRFGGLGLGLAISKMLVDLHHGRIRAWSEGRNRGATFTVELPIHHPAPGEKASPAPVQPSPPRMHPSTSATGTIPASPADGPAKRRRVLLVEDHAPTRQVLAHLLKERDFVVTTAGSATEAFRLATAAEFDLIVSDVGLPDRSGFELMAELRSLRPRLPGIALSGYGMDEDITRSRAAGFAVHLVKPITIGMLEDAIDRLPQPTGPIHLR